MRQTFHGVILKCSARALTKAEILRGLEYGSLARCRLEPDAGWQDHKDCEDRRHAGCHAPQETLPGPSGWTRLDS